METQDKQKKRPGPVPSGNALKNRTLRMDDTRWEFFRDSLGTPWLRNKIDEAIREASAHKALTNRYDKG